jgi:hypothetical protein
MYIQVILRVDYIMICSGTLLAADQQGLPNAIWKGIFPWLKT